MTLPTGPRFLRLHDDRHLNVDAVVWYRIGSRPLAHGYEAPFAEVKLADGELLRIEDASELAAFRELVEVQPGS
jgi:hypothetical protein